MAAGVRPPRKAAASANLATDVPWVGEKVIDCHFHGCPTDEGIIAHLDGAGITSTLILSQQDFARRMPGLRAKYPGRVAGWARGTMLASESGEETSVPATLPFEMRNIFQFIPTDEAAAIVTREVRAGAKGFGETAGLVQADGPELRRLYALAAELDVPILMHFQQSTAPGLPRYGVSGFSRLEAMLKAFPKTRFVCHASDFWGHIDKNFSDGGVFPAGKVDPGGLSDRLLADYPNMYGDLSAPSGFMQLSRDLEFTSGFLTRHQDKLVFGSDCGCADGRGGSKAGSTGPGAGSPGIPSAHGLAGKCVARELLGVVWNTTPRSAFHKLAWSNAHRIYKLPA